MKKPPHDLQEEPDDTSTPTSVEVPGWRRTSLNSPAFAQMAEELAVKLEGLGHEASRRRAAEGRALAATFRAWADTAPDDTERSKVIAALLEFNRAAVDMLSGSR